MVDNLSADKGHQYRIALLAIAALSRFAFVLDGFGETDAANIAVSVIDYISNGAKGYLTGLYFVDIVPLYVFYIKLFMKLLDNNYQHVVTVMNYTNALFGALMAVPAYLFTRRLFNSSSAAFYSALIFILTPSVFRTSVYGFPHLLSLFFFITALYFFLVWLDDTKYSCLLLAAISLSISVSLKSDLILGSGVFPGLLYIRKVRGKGKIVSPFMVVAFSFFSLLLLRHWMGIERGYTTSAPNFLELIRTYTGLLSTRGLYEITRMQAFPILYAAGIINFFAACAAFVYYLKKRRLDAVVLVLSWAAAPTVFWLLIYGNSARHNMISVLPFIIIMSLFLCRKAGRFRGLVAALIIVGNFVVPYPSFGKGAPSIDILNQQLLLNAKTRNIHSTARGIAGLETDKIIIAPNVFRAYLYYEMMGLSPDYELVKLEFGSGCHMFRAAGRQSMLCTNITEPEIVGAVPDHGMKEPVIVLPASHQAALSRLKEKGHAVYRYDHMRGMLKGDALIPSG